MAMVFASSSTTGLLCNLLSSCQNTDPPMSNILVVSFDSELAHHLPHIQQPILLFDLSSGPSESGQNTNPDVYRSLVLSKQLVIYWALQMGFGILSLDADIVMLKHFFNSIDNLDDFDVTGQGVGCESARVCHVVCGGLFFMPSNAVTIRATQYSMRVLSTRGRGRFHQAALNQAINRTNAKVQVLGVDQLTYLGEMDGQCLSIDKSRVIAVHATHHRGCRPKWLQGGCRVSWKR